jgi:RNA polymerase sigma-70 factor (ECF subfamily)
MNAEGEFRGLLERVQAGDELAATELVRRYEPYIRRAARVRLTDPRLRRSLDSLDVTQSVLGTFFARARAGRFQIDTPAQLVALLSTMARNRILDHARHERRRSIEEGGSARREPVEVLVSREPTPSHVLEDRDLLEALSHRLPPRERYLAEQRALGREWADLAGELGVPAGALRKRLSRALGRIAGTLGMESSAG